VSTSVSATIGVGILTLAGLAAPAQFGGVWLTWWLGDAAGAILVAPLLVLWFRDRRFTFSFKRVAEAALLFAAVLGVTALLFFAPPLADYPLAFLCMPLLVWAAFRFRPREVVTAAACMSTIATWATVTGNGPFVTATPNESLLVLQAFTAPVTLTALIMSALVQERLALLEREHAALAEAEAALRSSDVFLAMLSHELRNPLSAIAAAGIVLEQPGMAADWNVRAGQIIRRQTAVLKRLIDDLLDVAKITGGKMVLERRPLDLADAVTSAVQSLDPDARAPSIALQLSRVHVDAYCRAYSISSSKGRRGATACEAVSAWASRSCGASSRCTAARSRRAATAKGAGASSSCACRAPRRRPPSPCRKLLSAPQPLIGSC
jgi:signal transduction histidine kinase